MGWQDSPVVDQPAWASASVVNEDIDSSAIDLPTRSRLIQPTEYERPMDLELDAPGQGLAAKGIDVTTGAPAGRVRGSFAANEGYEAQFYRAALSDYYGGDVRVRKGPESGELEFLNPGTKRWTLIDEASAAIVDFADMVGHTIPVAGATAGFFAGTLGGPPGEVAGAGAGMAAGEAIRQNIGEGLGVNEGIEGPEIARDAVTLGAQEAALTAVLPGLVGLVKRGKQFMSPDPMSAQDAMLALTQMSSNRQLATDIEALAGKEFRPTSGQLSGDEFLLGVQTAYSGDSLEASVALSRQLNRNESALETAFDNINPTGDAYAAGRSVRSAVQDRIDPVTGKAAERLTRVTDDVRIPIASIPEVGEQAAGRKLRESLLSARDAAKAEETAAYRAYQEAYGLDGAASNVTIDTTRRFDSFVDTLNSERVNAIFAGQQTGKGQLLSEKLTSGEGFDLHQLEEGIKYLRRMVRKSGSAVAADAPTRDILRLKDELVLLRNTQLARIDPNLLALAEGAEAAAAKRAQLFDKSVLGAIIKKKDGEYLLNDTRVFAYVIKSNDQDAAAHFARVVSQDPGAIIAAKKGLWSYYRKEAAPDGIVEPKLHKKFMESHNHVINALFDESEVKRMNQLGDMGRVVERAAKRYDNLVTGINRHFSGRIRDTSPENLAATVFSRNFSAVDARQLSRIVDAGGAGESFRVAIGTHVRNRVFLNNKINANNLDRLLAKDGEKLKQIFGPEYVQNLEKLRDGAIMVRQTSKGLTPQKTNAFTDLMRVLFAPPLTQRGRGQTLVVNLRHNAAKRAIGEAVMDPKKLEAIVNLDRVDRQSRRAARLLSALGGYTALQD